MVASSVLLEITTTGKVTLLIVGGVFIAWALITAIFIPRRNPDFPADLTVFILVTAVLFASQMGAVYWVTSTQEVEHEAAGESDSGRDRPGRDHADGDGDDACGDDTIGWGRGGCDGGEGGVRVGGLWELPHVGGCGCEWECGPEPG